MTFSVLGFTGYWYGLVVGLGALAYLLAAGALGYAKRLSAGAVRLYGFLGIPLGLVFARLGFCAVNFEYFTQTVSQPWLMLRFWDGGLSLLGTLCGLTLAALLTARLRKIRFGTLLDVTVAPIGLLLFALRLAEAFTNGQLGVGRQVDAGELAALYPILFLAEQMGTLTLFRLAVYRYEAVAALLLLFMSLSLFYNRRQRRHARPGDVALIVYALFGAAQILLESLRDDGHMVIGFIRVQQVGYALLPLFALAVFCSRYAHIRQIRVSVVTAWVTLPLSALIAWMMIWPLNHVLDLTDHLLIGFILLGAMVAYMAFFLRVRGASVRLILSWIIALAAVAGCVMVEFSVDGSAHLWRDYAMMAGCCMVLFLAPYQLWRTLVNWVYGEESICVQIP